MIDQTVGLIAHLPLNAILKGSQGVEFQLVTVELERGHVAADTLRHLLDLNLNECFTVAAPLPPDVERSGGGDATHGSETPPPPTLDDWRQQALTWDTKRTEAFKLYRQANGITGDATDAEKLYAYNMFDQEYHFHDVETTPAVRPATPPATTVDPVTPDEGPPAADSDFDVMSTVYDDYPIEDRKWMAAHIKEAQRNGLDFQTAGGNRTTRRFHLLRALINIAQHPNRDQLLQAELRAIHGDILADHNPIGILCGFCDHHQAKQLADALTAHAENAA